LKKYLEDQNEIKEYEIIEFAINIFEGLAYLHSNRIMHNDIKPANILIGDNNELRIGDFGISKIVDHSHKTNIVGGTELYCSPRIFNKKIDFKNDI